MLSQIGMILLHLTAAPPSTVQEAPCGQLSADTLVARVDAVVRTSRPAESDSLPNLLDYWESRCGPDRADASPLAVRSIALLMRRSSTRMHAASMLHDVSRNLEYARGALRAAIADQRRIEAREARLTYPLQPPSHRVTVALDCLETRMRTGQAGGPECRGVGLEPVPAATRAARGR